MDERILITRQNGEVVNGVAPVIISASRSTDIPAFYAKWFINRLKAGYCVWYNPFNQKPMYISFVKTKAVVFGPRIQNHLFHISRNWIKGAFITTSK